MLYPVYLLYRKPRENISTSIRRPFVHLGPSYSSTSVSLAVFDSGLANLKLPILPPFRIEELEKQGEQEARERQIEYEPDTTPKTIPIPSLAYKYFELVGTFDCGR